MVMINFYGEAQRRLQDRFGTRRLADAEEQLIVTAALNDAQRAFIESRDMVFLTSVDKHGQPTVSYKGGAPGFLRVVDGAILMPCYDGNGMYLSMGNVEGEPRVGLLFIDFERPNRLRVHGRASLVEAGGIPGAEMMLRIVPHEIFVNCPRYIHAYEQGGFALPAGCDGKGAARRVEAHRGRGRPARRSRPSSRRGGGDDHQGSLRGCRARGARLRQRLTRPGESFPAPSCARPCRSRR